MDKELLARKLYVERVEALLGAQSLNENMLHRTSPGDAAKALTNSPISAGERPAWFARYLHRN
ncbi:MAG: hypothetical protein ACRC0U_10745, partial [Vibrio sp.]